jgi:hypothetical protein
MPKAISSEILKQRKEERRRQEELAKKRALKRKLTKTYCSVPGCGPVDEHISNFYLPKDPVKRAPWLNFLQMCRKEVEMDKNYRICERHFDEKLVVLTSSKKTLMFKAVPTLDLKHMVRFEWFLAATGNDGMNFRGRCLEMS